MDLNWTWNLNSGFITNPLLLLLIMRDETGDTDIPDRFLSRIYEYTIAVIFESVLIKTVDLNF